MSKNSRKNIVVQRLRNRLKVKSESLADQFEFRIYVAIIFKDSTKAPVLYQAAEVVPVMTNNYELDIMKAAEESKYSIENGKNLLEEDIVQLHSRGYCHVKGGNRAPATSMNFLIWPRSDIDHISCALFSRWRGDKNAQFQHIQQDFKIASSDYEWQITQLRHKHMKEMVISNSKQSLFMLLNYHQPAERRAEHCSLSGLCVFLPQAGLMSWDTLTEEEVLSSYRAK